MEQNEKEQKTNQEKEKQWGCFEPSSKVGRIMMKMMNKMCASMGKERFDCESMIKEMKLCKESK
jgi:hypothetical protein